MKKFLLSIVALFAVMAASADTRSWDFTQGANYPDVVNDTENWVLVSKGRYANVNALENQALQFNGADFEMTKGLTFTCQAQKVMFGITENFFMQCQGTVVMTVPSVAEGDTIVLVTRTATKNKEASISGNIADPVSTTSTSNITVTTTATATGDLALTLNNQVRLYSLTVKAPVDPEKEEWMATLANELELSNVWLSEYPIMESDMQDFQVVVDEAQAVYDNADSKTTEEINAVAVSLYNAMATYKAAANAYYKDALSELINTANAIENPSDALQKVLASATATLNDENCDFVDFKAAQAELQKAVDEELAPAKLVSVSPEPGTKVDLDTEYVLTFSKAVKYSSSLSDITIGQNPFGNYDGAIFSQSEDKKEIHAKLDASTLAMYGVTTVDQAVAMFGSSVALHVYKVKDAKTGENLEYNDPDDEDQFTYTYKMGDPALKIETQDGVSSTVNSLETIYFACSEGIALADPTQKITIVNGKTIAYQATADQLVAANNEPGLMDGDDDNFGVDDQPTSVSYYTLTIDPAITEAGEYTVQVPEGTFTLGGEVLNKYAEATYTVGAAVVDAINVTPAPGEVATLKDFVFTYGNGKAIMPSYNVGMDITITNAAGETVATITQDDLQPGTTYEEYDEYFNPIVLYASIPEITTAGTYTMNIPAGAFNVTDGYLTSEAATFTWTVTGGEATPSLVKSIEATYTNYSADYPNYNDSDWGMVEGAKFTVDMYDNDSLVIRNWMNQNLDLCVKYDATGYVTAVNNPGGVPSYWAYASSSYWAYVSTTSYYSSSWVTNDGLFLLFSWGTSWDNYYLSFKEAPKPIVFTSDPADGSTVDQISKITYTFSSAISADLGAGTPTITNAAGESASNMVYLSYGVGLNQLILETIPVTESGTYTVTIPAGAITLDNVATTQDVVITLTVSGTVGINGVAANENNAARFNLAGQKVNTTAKGVVIMNGKKYMVK